MKTKRQQLENVNTENVVAESVNTENVVAESVRANMGIKMQVQLERLQEKIMIAENRGRIQVISEVAKYLHSQPNAVIRSIKESLPVLNDTEVQLFGWYLGIKKSGIKCTVEDIQSVKNSDIIKLAKKYANYVDADGYMCKKVKIDDNSYTFDRIDKFSVNNLFTLPAKRKLANKTATLIECGKVYTK